MNREFGVSFGCFGGTCLLVATGGVEAGIAAKLRLLDWHARYTRFDPASELCRLNADPREAVPVSPVLARLAQAIVDAAELSGGLVDGTLARELEAAGYRSDLDGSLPLRRAADPRPARPRSDARWRGLSVDGAVVRRPPGLAIDSGGLGKGLFADLVAEDLRGQEAFAIECAGDLRVGGTAGRRRPVNVESPFDRSVIHTFELADAGVATSGIGRRSWLDARGRPAHHLLDPSTGLPAFTGVVQATAVAPTALEAEVRAKAALLSGPERATDWLPHGGVIVHDDGSHTSVTVPPGGRARAERQRHAPGGEGRLRAGAPAPAR